MKKVKIMLTAITMFAVVGGALAFKAQKFGGLETLYKKGIDGKCNVEITENQYTYTEITPTTLTEVSFVFDGVCETLEVTTQEQ